MEKIESFRSEIINCGLTGKSVKDLMSVNSALYHRIYSYARKEKLWLSELFIDLGLDLIRIDGINSIERLDKFMGEKMLGYMNKNLSNISQTHRTLIRKVLKNLDMSFDTFLLRYNMSSFDSQIIYESIDDIKEDLISKELVGATISQIMSFEGGRVISNIDSFAKRNDINLKDLWSSLGIAYSPNVIICDNGRTKIDFIYHNYGEIEKGFIAKGLIGKNKREVWFYDKGTTCMRVIRYAKRSDVTVQSIWEKLGVKDSPRKNIKLSFSNLEELKIIIGKKGLVGKTIQDLIFVDSDLWLEVKKYSKKGTSMKHIWKYVGIKTQGFYSVEDIVSEIKDNGYKNLREIRGNRSLYKRIISFTNSYGVKLCEIWGMAGIVIVPGSGGRPNKISQ